MKKKTVFPCVNVEGNVNIEKFGHYVSGRSHLY